MNIYVYSDESGVFDHLHNDYFVFGGIICFSTKERNDNARKYSHVEKVIRESGKYPEDYELKASNITNAEKGKIFRSLNNVFKFSVSIREKALNFSIFNSKRHKQRYLDYAYKLVLKKCFETLIKQGYLNPDDVDYIYVYADEHSTATDGKYELRENLLNEFKFGTFNFEWDKYFDPIFPRLKDVCLQFADSSRDTLVRAADIVANHCYHIALGNGGTVKEQRNMFSFLLPDTVVVEDGCDYFKK